MPALFHDGELAVQARAGVRAAAAKVGLGIRDAMPAAAQAFLREQRFAVLGGGDQVGARWASPLHGAAGFLTPLDEQHLRIGAPLASGDPLAGALVPGTAVALLAIDFASRRRMRLNGVVDGADAAGVVVRAREVFANCPKYIRRRALGEATPRPTGTARRVEGAVLTAAQRARVAAADTFFIATAHPDAGADVSHRGGDAGFVQVVGAATLRWPDHTGNMMFQTLGNLAVDPRAGLLFVDFDDGSALYLSGTAAARWNDHAVADTPVAERVVEFSLQRVVALAGAAPGGWHALDATASP